MMMLAGEFCIFTLGDADWYFLKVLVYLLQSKSRDYEYELLDPDVSLLPV